ncbi:thioredoxin family protein [Candidatus Saccharibacteria bacterium]|nr:thioredoxin family protein [Candidatus Saccharibacteria bacterium]
MIKGTDENFSSEVLEAAGLVLVDFNADWCGPCQMMKPVVEKFGEENDLKVVSVNVDDFEELSDSYGVYTIPCLVLFRDGKEIAREEGVVSPKKLAKMLEK